MGFGLCCSKTILIIANIISLILGLALLVTGCILKFGQSIIDQVLRSLLPPDSNIDLNVLLGDVAIALIVIGSVIFLISIFGCCGACCNSKCMLAVYAVVVGVLLTAELICVILVVAMKDKLDSFLKKQFNNTIVDSYGGFRSTDTISLAWNLIQIELKCCGVENYTDFHLAKKWESNITLPNVPVSQTLKLPVTCCKLNGSISDLASIDLTDVGTCVSNPTIQNANIETGCYEAVEKVIASQSAITIAVTTSILVCQLILVILACCVCTFKKEDREDNKVHPS